VLGINQRAVRGNVEHTAAALDELGLHAELLGDFGRQTGGPREVASTAAVLDGDVHDLFREERYDTAEGHGNAKQASRGRMHNHRFETHRGKHMRIHNLYTDANGQSHFRDIEIEWAEERRGSKLSKRLPATGIIFRETVAEYDLDWHPAPRRQYIVNLDAGVKLTASDGESRVIAAGEIILVEDTTGKGHLSQGLGQMRHSLFIPVE